MPSFSKLHDLFLQQAASFKDVEGVLYHKQEDTKAGVVYGTNIIYVCDLADHIDLTEDTCYSENKSEIFWIKELELHMKD